MDTSKWDSSDFEYLVRLLLQAEGNQAIQFDPRAHDVGIDLTVTGPSMNENQAVIQCKFTNKAHSISEIMLYAEELERKRDYLQADLAYLVTSGYVPAEDREYIDDHCGIVLWDRTTIESLLVKHNHVRSAFDKHIAEIQQTGRLAAR